MRRWDMKSLLVLLIFVGFVNADYLMRYTMGNEKGTFYYKDATHQKLQTTSDICKGGEIYKTPKGVYAVNYADGEVMIIDMMQARSFMQSMGMTGTGTQQGGKNHDPYAGYEIEKTSKSRYIAGLKAYKWILIDKKSKKRYVIYVSDDKRLAKLSKAFYKLLTTAVPQDQNTFLLQKRYVIVEGEGYKLESFKKVSKPLSFYTLPTKGSKVAQKCKEQSTKRQKDKKTSSHPKERIEKEETHEETPSAEDFENAAELLKSLF